MRANEAMAAHNAYLVGSFMTSFVLTVMLKVSGNTVVDGTSPSSTRQGFPFSITKIFGRWP